MEPYAVPNWHDASYSMSKCDDLLEKARNNRKGLRYEELVQLAECHGFRFARQRATSHAIYKREGYRDHLNFQPKKDGKAKPAQVRSLLKAIEELTTPSDAKPESEVPDSNRVE
jgi:hypothetical protein